MHLTFYNKFEILLVVLSSRVRNNGELNQQLADIVDWCSRTVVKYANPLLSSINPLDNYDIRTISWIPIILYKIH